MQGQKTAHNGKGHVGADARVLEVAKHDKEKQKDEEEADGYDLFQAFGGALLVLEVSLPDHAIALLQTDRTVHPALDKSFCSTTNKSVTKARFTVSAAGRRYKRHPRL